jgi:thiamine biosynthesis lipoprotein ApbE
VTVPELVLVVPCHNEAERLDPEAFLHFASTHPAAQLLFVDDGSEDGTRAVLERLRGAAPSAVTVLHHAPRRGKGEAVRAGILSAIERRAPLVGYLDADLSTPLHAIDDFLEVLRDRPGVEFVLGSRVMLLGRDIRRRALRHYVGRVFATGASLALDLPVYDTQCGAKVLRVSAATATLFEEPFRSPWLFDVELIARFLRLPVAPGEPARRDRIYELALSAWHDVPGSKVRWHDVVRAVGDLGHVWRERVAHERRSRAGAIPGSSLGGARASPTAAAAVREGDRETTREAPDGGLGIEERPGRREVRRFSHDAMATVFEVYCDHPDGRYAAQAAQAAFDVTDRLERELSRFLPNSDVARVNGLAAGGRTQVGPAAMECLVIARHVFALTGGAFDVALGTGLASLDLDPERLLVAATQDGVQIDLGGIGKGYAVDRMAEVLEEWGVTRALVHGGFSSVLALEPPAGCAGWPLTLSDPRVPSRVLEHLSTRQVALGASGLRKGDHVRDPRTGGPAAGRRAAWTAVTRPGAARDPAATEAEGGISTAALADALATAFMVMSVEEIAVLCGRSPGLQAWLLPREAAGGPEEPQLRHFGPG